MKKVVVIAGGGVFGYLPAYFMKSALGCEDVHKKIDAIGGTSVGGILSLLYAAGMNAAAAHDAFKEMVDQAFPQKWYTRIKFWGPKYSGRGLVKVLGRTLGETLLKELKMPVIVPTLDFTHNKPKIWDNFEGNPDGYKPAWEVARMTSAAPTYFPPYQGHIDGGILSNMPILETCAALKHKKGWHFSDMDVMVIGTGKKAMDSYPQRKIEKWNSLQWVMPLIEYLTYANEEASKFVAKQLGLGGLTIHNPVQLKKSWDMDDPKLLPVLEQEAAKYRYGFDSIMKAYLAK